MSEWIDGLTRPFARPERPSAAAASHAVGMKRQEPQRERLPEDARADEGQPADALEQEAVRDRRCR